MCFESYIWIFNYRNYDTGFLNQQNPIQYACSLLLYLACQHRCQFLTSWFDCNSVSLMQVKVNTWDKCLVWLFCCFIYIQPSKQASQPALSFLCSKNKASHNKLSQFFFICTRGKQAASFFSNEKKGTFTSSPVWLLYEQIQTKFFPNRLKSQRPKRLVFVILLSPLIT